MIDSSKKHNRQLAFELQNLHVCEKRSKKPLTCNIKVTNEWGFNCILNSAF